MKARFYSKHWDFFCQEKHAFWLHQEISDIVVIDACLSSGCVFMSISLKKIFKKQNKNLCIVENYILERLNFTYMLFQLSQKLDSDLLKWLPKKDNYE